MLTEIDCFMVSALWCIQEKQWCHLLSDQFSILASSTSLEVPESSFSTEQSESQFSSVQSFRHVRLSVTPWAAACQASLSITDYCSLLKLMSIESVMPSNHLILCHPFLLLSSIFPSIRVFFPVSHLFTSHDQSIGASTSASVLSMNIQDWSPLGLIGLISLSPRDSQGSSPTPQFKSINYLALSLLHSSTLTSIYDYWKNHSLD